MKMPIKCNRGKVRYRAKRIDKDEFIRLAYCQNKVVETKVKRYKR